jgi:hypothetical protein
MLSFGKCYHSVNVFNIGVRPKVSLYVASTVFETITIKAKLLASAFKNLNKIIIKQNNILKKNFFMLAKTKKLFNLFFNFNGRH